MTRRGKNSKAALLREVALFSACGPKELGLIARVADEISVPEGKVITSEGQAGREFFVIADGKAKVAVGGKRVATLGPGDFFGEMALLEDLPRAATVTAESDMELYVVERRAFTALVSEAPTVAIKIMRGLAHRVRALEKSFAH